MRCCTILFLACVHGSTRLQHHHPRLTTASVHGLSARVEPAKPPLGAEVQVPAVLGRLRGGGDVGAFALLPPVVALVASVALKQVIVALLLGVWTGATLLSGVNPLIGGLRTFDTFLVDAFNAPDHAGVLLFTLMLGGTIGVVQKGGGALALAELLQRSLSSAKHSLVCAWGLCNLIFFDDYSSILIVGNAIRPALPALQLAPERLALVVHVMGVALASLSPVSSWVGLQIGYVSSVYTQLGLPSDGFVSTMKTLPYRFLPILLLLLLPILLTTGRDLGPMARYPLPHKAITASSSKVVSEESSAPGPLDPKPGTKARVINALLPFSTIAVVTFAGMLLDGFSKLKARGDNSALTLVGILSESDSINALIWSSAAGWLVAMGLMLGQGVLSLSEAMDAWMEGMKEVLEPAFVLLLAWALGDVIGRLKAADWLARSLHSGLPRWVLPPLISILAHLISYACGSSFGTMGIILPLVGPLALKLGKGDPQYLSHCIGSVLGGAVFGNICSPISDTTILTVLATRCDLQAHVASITPYTLLAAVTALVFGSAPVALGCYGPFTALIISAAAMTLTVRFAGRKPPEQ